MVGLNNNHIEVMIIIIIKIKRDTSDKNINYHFKKVDISILRSNHS